VKTWALYGAVLLVAGMVCPATADLDLRQTNSGGDDIHVSGVATHRLLPRIVVGPEPHGLAARRDAGVAAHDPAQPVFS